MTLVLIDTLAPFPFSTQVLPQLEGTLFTTDFSSRTFGFSVPAQGTAGSFNFTALGFQEVEITNFTPTTFTFCDGRSNSTGVAAELEAVGQTSVSANDLRLHMSNMPMNSFGFFLVSRTPGLVPGAGGGPGTLCLDGAIGRYVAPGQIQTSGTQGEISLQLDLNQVPTPNGPVAVLAGERWHFQGWYRDIIAGNATSNFSSGVWVEFQ